MEVIEIKNGIVTLYEQTIVRQVGVAPFKERLASSLGVRTPILPCGTILYTANQGRSCFVIEQEPAMRAIQFKPDSTRALTYTIPTPWVYLALVYEGYALDQMSAYFSSKPVENEKDMLCLPPLPNVFADGAVCLGSYRATITRHLTNRIAHAIHQFWASPFTTDGANLHEHHVPERIRNATQPGEEIFAGWARIPLADVCLLDWHPYKTFADAIPKIAD